MNPTEVSELLRRIASYVEESENPSKSKVAGHLFQILLATDKSLALTIRDATLGEIVKLMPNEFNGELYDTNPEGKGFLAGYVSFALDPQTWESNGIIGGILFKLKYYPKSFKSQAPEGGYGPEQKHPKGQTIIKLAVEAGYYNKKIDGSYSSGRPLDEIWVEVDPKEQLIDVTIVDPGAMKSGVDDLINEIVQSPPEYAQSAGRKQKQTKEKTAPTSNVRALHKWLMTQPQGKENTVWGTQLNSLAQGRSAEKGTTFHAELKSATDYFSSRGWKIDHQK
jgi:hypothetical protein